MNIIMAQKLNLLHLSLFKNATDIDTSFFDELNEEDCQSLLRLNQVAKKHMFIQIVSEMAKVNESI
jgi:ABC-type antimicrobial peptide transport system ATPase subunit